MGALRRLLALALRPKIHATVIAAAGAALATVGLHEIYAPLAPLALGTLLIAYGLFVVDIGKS